MTADTSQTALLIDTYLNALRRGDAPSVTTFADRHPDRREELASLLPLMAEMEGFRQEDILQDAAETLREPPLPRPLGNELILLRRLGEGGMGTVYEAEQKLLKRTCAVKRLSPVYSERAAARERFVHEARTIARLRHPNIVPVHSAGIADGRFYFTMDLMEGPDLRSLAATPQAVARIGIQAAHALAHAHNFGILHCDVKPSNLLTDADGTVMLSDFGLSRLQASQSEDLGGTFRYMAPERLRREPFSELSDQYSLGMTLRGLLTGTPPPEQHPGAYVPPPPLPDTFPKDLTAVIEKMSAPDPAQRYRSVSQASDDLTYFLEHRPVTARPASVFRRLRLSIRRRPLTAAACFLTLICALGALGALSLGHLRTHRARQQAEENAQLAHDTIRQLFRHIRTSVPSREGTKLLSRLLPYYQNISSNSGLPSKELQDAYETIGLSAMHCGQYDLAADALENLCRLNPSPTNLENHTLALYHTNSQETARKANAGLIERFKDSPDVNARLVALSALDRCNIKHPNGTDLTIRLLRSLENDAPKHKMLNFLKADIRRRHPEIAAAAGLPPADTPTVPPAPNVFAHRTGTRPAIFPYSIWLLHHTANLLDQAKQTEDVPKDLLHTAVSEAERLIGENPGSVRIGTVAMYFWTKHREYLHRLGTPREADAFDDYLCNLLGLLYHGRGTQKIYQRGLMQILLQRLNAAALAGNTDGLRRLAALFDTKIPYYRGTDKEPLIRRVHGFLNTAPAPSPDTVRQGHGPPKKQP